MNSNQRSQANNQSSNGGNEKSVSSYRAGTVEKDNIDPAAQRSGALNSATPAGQQNDPAGSAQRGNQDSTDRSGSQTGNLQKTDGPIHESNEEVHQSNDAAGGYPRSPGGANQLSADEKMDDDTGFSKGGYRMPSEVDDGTRQEQQSNVGRRSDMTPD